MKAKPTIGDLDVGSAALTEALGWVLITGHAVHGWVLIRYWDHESKQESLAGGPDVASGSLPVIEHYPARAVARVGPGASYDPLLDGAQGRKPRGRTR